MTRAKSTSLRLSTSWRTTTAISWRWFPPSRSRTKSPLTRRPYYIFEVIEEDGEEQLQEVDDDALLDKLAAIFEERFNEAYFDGEEE